MGCLNFDDFKDSRIKNFRGDERFELEPKSKKVERQRSAASQLHSIRVWTSSIHSMDDAYQVPTYGCKLLEGADHGCRYSNILSNLILKGTLHQRSPVQIPK